MDRRQGRFHLGSKVHIMEASHTDGTRDGKPILPKDFHGADGDVIIDANSGGKGNFAGKEKFGLRAPSGNRGGRLLDNSQARIPTPKYLVH